MRISRRSLLTGAAGGIAAAALPRATWAATGLTLGEMEVLTLSDGFLTQPADFIFGPMPQAELVPYLAGLGIDRQAPLTPPCTLTLVRHEGRVVLFDAGSGTGFMPSAGDLPDALAAAGVDPSEVTHVVFTHGHADHLWGVLDDFDEPFFTNAQHMMGRAEFDYWMDPETVNTAAPERVTMAVGAARRLEVLAPAMTFFEDGQEILPGIAARATFGHSPGHMSFELAQGANSLMVVGDALLNAHTAFAHPDWEFGADADGAGAAAARVSLLDQMAQAQMMMIGFHLPGTGLGHVERAEGAYRFVPA